MMQFKLSIETPFIKPYWKNLGSRSFSLSKNKSLEVQATIWTTALFGIDIDWRSRQDHAGLFISLSFMMFEFYINVYDGRHWDHENNCWEKYDATVT